MPGRVGEGGRGGLLWAAPSLRIIETALVSSPVIKETKHSADDSRRTIPLTDDLTFSRTLTLTLDLRPRPKRRPVGP